MGYRQQRFSPLAHINRDNVKRLVPAWSYTMADNRGQEAQPLVKDGVLYLTDHEKTVAIDALSGKQLGNQCLNTRRYHTGGLLRHRQSWRRAV